MQFRLTNVCKTCNNRLGLFVDASYGKSWFLTNTFATAARSLCTAIKDPGLPLVYIGSVNIAGLKTPKELIAESWVGPSGETVIWIRKHDERMDSYAGGNPIGARKEPSVAYYFPVSDEERFWLGWRSFQRAFAKREARKILGVEIEGTEEDDDARLNRLRFDDPSDTDKENIAAIRIALKGKLGGHITMNLKFSHRFMCKMAIAVGFSLFGQNFLNGNVILKARKGLWPKKEAGVSELRGGDPLRMMNSNIGAMAGYPGAVAVIVIYAGRKWSLTVSVDEKMPFTVELGEDALESLYVNQEEGYALLLFPYLDKAVEVTVAGLYAHRLGSIHNMELKEIDKRRYDSTLFWEKLVSSSDIH